jgi:exonuclease VII large subunit
LEPAIAFDSCCRTDTPCVAQVKLARAEAQLQAERELRSRLEYILREEVGQELAGISLLVAALRRQSRPASGADSALQQIADLLTASIGHCCAEARTAQRARR